MLEPFGIKRFYTGDWGAYDRHIDKKSTKLVRLIRKK